SVTPGNPPPRFFGAGLPPTPSRGPPETPPPRHYHPHRVHHHVPLPAVDFLVRVLAVRPAPLGRLDALAIDDPHARALLSPVAVADPGAQGVIDPGPSAVVAPFAKVVVTGAPGR